MKLIIPAVAAVVLAAASLGAQAQTSARLFGDSAPVTSAQRTVIITPNTRWITVSQGDVVKFVANGNEFAFDFNGQGGDLDLAHIAPAGALDHKVTVYLAPQI